MINNLFSICADNQRDKEAFYKEQTNIRKEGSLIGNITN